MHFAFINSDMTIRGGAENYMLWLARGLISRGHQVTVITPALNGGLAEELTRAGAFRYQLPVPRRMRPGRDLPALGRRLASLLSTVDIALSHDIASTWWLGAACEFNPTLPAAWFCHDTPRRLYPELADPHWLAAGISPLPPWTRAWDRMMNTDLRKLDQKMVKILPLVIANSRYQAGKLAAIYGSIPVVALPLGVPDLAATLDGAGSSDRNEPNESVSKREALPAPGYVLSVGRLAASKNLATLVRALHILTHRRAPAASPPPRLVILGQGEESEALQKLVGRLGLQDQVTFTGRVSGSTLAEYYARSALVACIPFDESFGLVAVEAGWFEKPVLASDHGGPAEIVEDGINGLLVNPADPDAVARALGHLLFDSPAAQKMGRAHRQRVSLQHDFERYIDDFIRTVTPLGRPSSAFSRAGAPAAPSIAESTAPCRVVSLMIMGARPEVFLAAALESVAGAVDRVVINDNSGLAEHPNLEVVRRSFMWRSGKITIIPSPFDGFSNCRNRCLELIKAQEVPGTWILMHDCDEVHPAALGWLTRGLLPGLGKEIGILEGYAVQLMQSFEWITGLERRHNMLFRLTPHLHWEGTVHEKPVGMTGRCLAMPYLYGHYGYAIPTACLLEKWKFYDQWGDKSYDYLDRVDPTYMMDTESRNVMHFACRHPAAVQSLVRSVESIPDSFVHRFESLVHTGQNFNLRWLSRMRKLNFLLRPFWRSIQWRLWFGLPRAARQALPQIQAGMRVEEPGDPP